MAGRPYCCRLESTGSRLGQDHDWPHASFLKAFADLGFTPPEVFFWSSFLIEMLGGICIILGLFTRFFAAAAAIEMLCIAVTYWSSGNGFGWMKRGYEYVLLWGLVCFAIALRGGSPYSIDRKIGRQTFEYCVTKARNSITVGRRIVAPWPFGAVSLKPSSLRVRPTSPAHAAGLFCWGGPLSPQWRSSMSSPCGSFSLILTGWQIVPRISNAPSAEPNIWLFLAIINRLRGQSALNAERCYQRWRRGGTFITRLCQLEGRLPVGADDLSPPSHR